jgi:two-component system OmpR family response regulator/two-component system alkaline phosphatase synthesis response regulator PhoP
MAVKRVLVVDDDPDIVDYLGFFLGDEGYEVSSAGRSSAALNALDEFEPDAVILDVVLPGKSGLDLLVHIRQHERWSEVPIIVLTGNDAIVQDNGKNYLAGFRLERGADLVLAKPVDRDALIAVLAALTKSRGAKLHEDT